MDVLHFRWPGGDHMPILKFYMLMILQALLGDPKFLESLQTYEKDNILAAVIEKVRPYLVHPDFEAETVKKASKAAAGLCSWVRAIEAYDRVAKIVQPKRAALKVAEEEVAVLMHSLEAKQAQLKQVGHPCLLISPATYRSCT
jgi:dynein heavy chain, axonemal